MSDGNGAGRGPHRTRLHAQRASRAGPRGNEPCQAAPDASWGPAMLKILLWIVVIIFLIGLLVVTGIIDLIF